SLVECRGENGQVEGLGGGRLAGTEFRRERIHGSAVGIGKQNAGQQRGGRKRRGIDETVVQHRLWLLDEDAIAPTDAPVGVASGTPGEAQTRREFAQPPRRTALGTSRVSSKQHVTRRVGI